MQFELQAYDTVMRKSQGSGTAFFTADDVSGTRRLLIEPDATDSGQTLVAVWEGAQLQVAFELTADQAAAIVRLLSPQSHGSGPSRD